jgi:hypothetical protein
MKLIHLLLCAGLVACGGESIEGEPSCTPVVRLQNPGPKPGGCFVAHAVEGTVRLVGDDGPGAPSVEVRDTGYEVISCTPLVDGGGPWVAPCSGEE